MLQFLGCHQPPGLWAPRSQTPFLLPILRSHDPEPHRRPRPALQQRSSDGVADQLAARGAVVCAAAEISSNPVKCLIVDNTGGGGKPQTAVREGLLLRGSNHGVLGTSVARPRRVGLSPGWEEGTSPTEGAGGWWSTSSGHVSLLTHALSVHSPPYNPTGTDAKVDHTCWGEIMPPISFLHLLPSKVRLTE